MEPRESLAGDDGELSVLSGNPAWKTELQGMQSLGQKPRVLVEPRVTCHHWSLELIVTGKKEGTGDEGEGGAAVQIKV